MGGKIRVGVIGCGNISGIYLENLKRFDVTEVAACADLVMKKAKTKAEEFSVPKACTVDELLNDPEIGIVVNLTTPKAHAEVALKALAKGKSVYNEKPLALSLEQGRKILALARKRKLLVGCAPDTFMGAGIQTCRKLIDDGAIGKPVAATAFMMCHGHESWHPDPEFYYDVGGGPMFDMGPYYLTALVNLIGPVRRVCGVARAAFPERTITSAAKRGRKIRVKTPTHIAGTIEFSNNAVGTIITSFDVWHHTLPHIEIHGTLGSLQVPDPNCFGGPVRMRRAEDRKWLNVPLSHRYAKNSRGVGVADMARVLGAGHNPIASSQSGLCPKPPKHRANGALALHVLETMHAFLRASKTGKNVAIRSGCDRPGPMNADAEEWKLIPGKKKQPERR